MSLTIGGVAAIISALTALGSAGAGASSRNEQERNNEIAKNKNEKIDEEKQKKIADIYAQRRKAALGKIIGSKLMSLPDNYTPETKYYEPIQASNNVANILGGASQVSSTAAGIANSINNDGTPKTRITKEMVPPSADSSTNFNPDVYNPIV